MSVLERQERQEREFRAGNVEYAVCVGYGILRYHAEGGREGSGSLSLSVVVLAFSNSLPS